MSTSMLMPQQLGTTRRAYLRVLAVLFVLALAAAATFAVVRATASAHHAHAAVTVVHESGNGPADLCRIPRHAC
jgi:hypothetical protein